MNSEKQSTNLRMTLREVNRVGEGQKNVPKLRFKGYEDAWEQRKLGDIAENTYGGGTPKTTVEEFWNGEIPWIQSSDIQEDQVFNVQVRKTITEKGLANSAAKLIPKNSIAIVTRVGVGKLGLIPFDFTTSQDFLSLSSLNIDSNFALYLLFKRLQFESKMAQGTSIKGITKEELLSKEVKIAHIDMEQKSIGYFFQNLDDIITLHQRKYDALKTMKKTLLSKMFPKDGEDVPEIRFKEFTDAWEQRKLGEVGTTYTGLSGKTKEDFGHGNGRFITYMNVFSNAVASSEMVEPVEIDDRQNKVIAGDVLFTTSSETPEEVGMSSVWLANSKNTYLNSFCFGYRPIIPFDPYYLAFMLRSSLMRKKITFLAQGISRYNISKNKMMDIEIPVPIMSEQHQIGEYFRNLDYLITLHQRKLDELKNMKKTLLQQMFV